MARAPGPGGRREVPDDLQADPLLWDLNLSSRISQNETMGKGIVNNNDDKNNNKG